ncbi:hypothetical protein EGI22_13050 [Lacihabitans sp. LS3-19]|uniref:hypothetical protein n=1 Tax=Lacihabitans sp. LS3-19 TaxID=2487335 RepID=UPI0020CC1F28|nr:hypothetical protein [Lacihabitans sp. LS3-19]MCP9768847.1 hypothetical protein [Lacihabitans sp. LS3-19]
MKKIIGFLLVVLVASSCISKAIDPLAGCTKSAEKFSTASSAFFMDFTSKTKCEAFKDAAKAYLKDCPSLSVSEVKEANDSINDIDCNDL